MTPFRRLMHLVTTSLILAVPLDLTSATTTDTREWQFRVYLDDREIGYHDFRLTNVGQAQELETAARFNIKFLFFNAYEYEHVNSEQWDGDCLRRIESRTVANGEVYSVRGSQQQGRFLISTRDKQLSLPKCIMTFAYWNPEFLNESRLLNSQTGEYLDISVEPAALENVTVRGERVPALHYSLSANGLQLDLWYSKNQEWLGLESVTESGRKLRYVLM